MKGKRMEPQAEESKGKGCFDKAIWAAVLSPVLIIVAIVAAIGVPKYISYQRTLSDKAASHDIESLGNALKRFADERKKQGCAMEKLPPEIVEYMVGPKYGWAGTNRDHGVLIRIDGDVVRGCSTSGSQPTNDPKVRYLFGVNLLTGEFVKWTRGECSGKSYGGPGSEQFVGSALGPGCTIQKPKRSQ